VRGYRRKRQNSDGSLPRLGAEHHPLSLPQPYFWAEPAVFVSSGLVSMGTGGAFLVSSFCPELGGMRGGVVSELSFFMPDPSQDRVRPLPQTSDPFDP